MRRILLATFVLALWMTSTGSAQNNKAASQALRPGTFVGQLVRKNGNSLTMRVKVPRIQGNPQAQAKNVQKIIQDAIRQQQRSLQNNRNGNRNNNRNRYNNRNRNNRNRNSRNNSRSSQQQLVRLQQQLRNSKTPKQAAQIQRQIQQTLVRLRQQSMQQAQRTAQAQQRAAQQIQKNLQNLAKKGGGVKIVTDSKDYVITLAADVRIRSLQPPFVYDDMGNPKEYTKEELKKLKGDNPRIPGYQAELTSLESGQVLQVTLGTVKGARQVQALMVVIVQESSGALDSKGKKKK